MVAALDDDVHSLFEGRKPPKKGRPKQKSEEVQPKQAQSKKTPPLALLGKESL
jgi:hypothetical protein